MPANASSMCCRNSQAVFLSALSTSWVTANLLVRCKRDAAPLLPLLI